MVVIRISKTQKIFILSLFMNFKLVTHMISLHYAIISGNFDIVKFLIENGADLNIRDKSGASFIF